MKKLFIIAISAVTLSLLIVNCNKSTVPPANTFKDSITYNNKVYDVNTGLLEYYGKIKGSGFNIDLTLVSSGLTPVVVNGVVDSIKGTGNGINFEIFTTKSTSLDIGDYNFDASKTGAAGTFDYANTILDFNTVTQKGIDLDIKAGKVTIKQIASEYELNFSCTGVDGKSVTGYYKGSLQYYDNSSIMKSGKIKKLRKW